ncbi:MAG: shikimate kinase, partial [Actinomycetota bacterium]|nr:shikimate kinase [Actinomycetota bacterium]
MNHIFLIGFMGAGKTTVGRLLAEMLGVRCIDLDARIEREAGLTIPEIFKVGGEQLFRDKESAVLRSLVNEPGAVVACGGGVVLRDAKRVFLREHGTVVDLRVTAGEALARLAGDGSRPLLAGDSVSMAPALLAARERLYEGASTLA